MSSDVTVDERGLDLALSVLAEAKDYLENLDKKRAMKIAGKIELVLERLDPDEDEDEDEDEDGSILGDMDDDDEVDGPDLEEGDFDDD